MADNEFEDVNPADFEDVAPKQNKKAIMQAPSDRIAASGEMYEDKRGIFGNISDAARREALLIGGHFAKGASFGLAKPVVEPEQSIGGQPTNLKELTDPFVALAADYLGSYASGMGIGKGLGLAGKGINTMTKNAMPKAAEAFSKNTGEFFKKIPTALSRSKGANFATKIQDVFFDAKSGASGFGKQYETAANAIADANPGAGVDIRNTLAQLNDEALSNPKIKTLLSRIPKLKSLAENPEAADNLTMKEARELKTLISSKISPAKYAGKMTFAPEDRAVLDVADNLRNDILEAFPDMQGVNAQYTKKIKAYNDLRRKVYSDNLLSGLKENLSNPQVFAKIKDIFPKDAVREMESYVRAKQAMTAVGAGAGAVGLGAAGVEGWKLASGGK